MSCLSRSLLFEKRRKHSGKALGHRRLGEKNQVSVVPSSDSPIHGMHHYYANEPGRTTLSNGGSNDYPDGTVFVGKVYAPVETDDGRYKEGNLVAYTLMQKDARTNETEATGGWHFVMFDAEGKNKNVNPVQDCLGCHQPSAEADYVLSTPLR